MKKTLLICALTSLFDTRVVAQELHHDECPAKLEGDITTEVVVSIMKTIETTCDKQARIKLHIASEGGFLYGTYMFYNFLMNWPGGVDTHGEHVMSSAVFIYLSGIKRTISATGLVALHRPYETLNQGQYGEVELLKRGNSLRNDRIKMTAIITKHTGPLDNEVYELIDRSTILTPEEAKAKGFVHEIVPLAR